MNKLYEDCLVLVTDLFRGKKDKGGYPYLDHLLTVSNKGKTYEEKLVGLLHDTFEDTDMTYQELKEFGVQDDILDAVVILTKKKGETYNEYIDRVKESKNELAINVKLNDLEHNMDIKRIACPTEKDYERLKKYERAHAILKGE